VRKALIVAVREYWALVASKAFLLSLLLAPLLGGLAIIVAKNAKQPNDGGPKQVIVVDRSSVVEARLVEVGRSVGLQVIGEAPSAVDATRMMALGDLLRRGELLAVVDVGPATMNGGDGSEIVIYVENLASSTARWLEGLVSDAVQLERLSRAGIDDIRASALMKPIAIDARPPPGPEGELTDEAAMARFITPLIVIVVVFMAVMTTVTPLLQAVVEEKQQRISEVLLGALAPGQLMLGKLLGTMAAGLTVIVLYGMSGYAVAAQLGLTQSLSLLSLLIICSVALLAMAMYGSVFLALGSVANELKDAQSMLTPIVLLLSGPMMFMSIIVNDPNGSLATALSLFPFTAPLIMPLRLGLTQAVPTWQIPVSLVLALGTTVAVVWASGRVFRIGILSQGKMPTVRELGRWILYG